MPTRLKGVGRQRVGIYCVNFFSTPRRDIVAVKPLLLPAPSVHGYNAAPLWRAACDVFLPSGGRRDEKTNADNPRN